MASSSQRGGSSTNTLPPALLSVFKTIHKLYDQNQYKRALKAADKVLHSAPKHGETLSMKGLVLNQLNRKQEAFAYARKGLKYEIKSHLCWHILGILYRTERLYFDAAKCFENALSYQEDNIQILRDLCMMHIQNRNNDGFVNISRRLVRKKPETRSNWSAFAVAAHLAGDHELALKIIDTYDTTVEKTDKEKYERSEILFYKVLIIEEQGDIKQALEELEKQKDAIVDKEEWNSKRGELLLKLSRFDDAVQQYDILINGNADNWSYYLGLLKAKQLVPLDLTTLRTNIDLPPQNVEKIVELCEELSKTHKHSKVARQIPLSFVTGNVFAQIFQQFIFPSLTKGVPSLFVLVKYLYSNRDKVKIIEDIFLEAEKNLVTIQKLSPIEELEEPPSTILWTWHFLSEHHTQLRQFQRALEYVKKCQNHTPTVLDFELTKAKIYKYAGDVITAARQTEEARSLDLADRYLNTKSTRFLLRADDIKQAEQTISIFTKVEPDNNSYRNNIYDMQVVWYEFEEGMSWYRQQKYGLALKRLTDIEKQFMDIHSDQLEFHSFCHRKMTLRQYVRMLRMEDNLFGHHFYFKAACQIVKIYLHLYTQPREQTQEDIDKLSPEERKKLERQKKKQEQQDKRKKEEQQKEIQEQLKKGKSNKLIDIDPNGDKLLESDPLSEATKYQNQLYKYSDNKLETHLLGYQVSLHRNKYLLALRSVIKALALAPNHPEVHLAVVKFFHSATATSLHPTITTVINLEKESILGKSTLQNYNDNYLHTHGHSLAARRIHFEAALLLGTYEKEKLLKNLTRLDDTTGYPLEESIKVHKLLLKHFGEHIACDYFKQCQNAFPLATYYSDKTQEQPPSQQQQEEQDEDADVEQQQHKN